MFRIREKKNRTRLEIVRDLLSATSDRSRKTSIMYCANLSYELLEKYLEIVLENGLVECIDDCFYEITAQGKEFLQIFNDYLERCKRIKKMIRGSRKERLLLENMCFNAEEASKRVRREREGLT